MPRVRMYPKHPFSQQCMCSIQNFPYSRFRLIRLHNNPSCRPWGCDCHHLPCCHPRLLHQEVSGPERMQDLKIHSPLLTFELNTFEYLFAILCKGGFSAERSRTTSTSTTGSTQRTGTLWWLLTTMLSMRKPKKGRKMFMTYYFNSLTNVIERYLAFIKC